MLAAAIFAGVAVMMGASSLAASEARETAQTPTAAPAPPPDSPEGRLAVGLRAAREDLGLSQSDVSERTGIAPSTIHDFETGRAVPSAESLKALSGVYQLSLDEWSLLEISRAEIR